MQWFHSTLGEQPCHHGPGTANPLHFPIELPAGKPMGRRRNYHPINTDIH
jgi:hypothetical protein